MQKLFSLLLLAAACAPAAYADIEGNGYYRVQNTESGRYITVRDNTGSISYTSMTADLGALETHGPFSDVVSDPSSILYITKVGSETYGPYDLAAQGTSCYTISSHFLRIRKFGTSQHYRAYATQSGATMYLYDTSSNGTTGGVKAAGDPPQVNGVRRWEWDALPVNAATDSYFGLKPDFALGGKYYLSLYASFPFSFASSGMKAYYIPTLDAANGIAVIEELSGTIPAATPVLIECSSNDPSQNRLHLLAPGTGSAVAGNQLVGVYFENWGRNNYVDNNTATMRVVGRRADGTLGLVKSTAQYMPRNRAYLPVPASAPAELKIMTRAEYDAFIAAQHVTLTARSYTRTYGDANPTFGYDKRGTADLGGTPTLTCAATATSPVGTYPIVISAGTVTNGYVDYVNGTLTVTPAPLTVLADGVERTYGDPNPTLTVTYEGFKNGETAAVLTTQPSVTTTATATSPVGTYPITPAGAAAQNYTITYDPAPLTILPAPLTVRAAQASREYGDANPTFAVTYEGFKNGETADVLTVRPTVTTTATATSPVGTYAITPANAAAQNYSIAYVGGTLTVTAAQLTASVGDYQRPEGEPNPTFAITYDGFKNGETAAVLQAEPVATTTATPSSPVGTYPITLSGGSAQNYTFRYVDGTLTILSASSLTDVTTGTDGAPFDVYSVTGARIRVQVSSLEGLPRGIYIVGGRKVIVR